MARLAMPRLAWAFRVDPREAAHRAFRALCGLPLYYSTRAGARPRGVSGVGWPWPGDAARGGALLNGEFRFAGTVVRGREALWNPVGVAPEWLAELHGFEWLADLYAVGGDTARASARELVAHWIEMQSRWRAETWHPDVLGARIASWLGFADYLLAGAEPDFARRFADSLARQVRHLRRTLRFVRGASRLGALRALVLAGLALAGEDKQLARRLAQLAAELDGQIQSDGGHVERSPVIQLMALRWLVELRVACRVRNVEVPQELQNAIDRAAPMLRFFRHGDGGLALFNDTNEGEPWLIDLVLSQAEARGKPLSAAPHSGFQRISANRTLVVMDAGAPAPRGLDSRAHAGTLSFEMSAGKERLITNCGAYVGTRDEWRRAQRSTAAHSTVSVDDLSSSDVLEPPVGLGRRPATIAVDRKESGGNVWIEASHDGFVRATGLTHRRRLYLAASGGDLRGEDTLSGFGVHRFAVRFHLHPHVQASMVQEGTTVLLRLPSGAGWRMRAAGGVVSLQESVYLGVRGEIRRTDQIVIAGATESGYAQVKWAIARHGRG